MFPLRHCSPPFTLVIAFILIFIIVIIIHAIILSQLNSNLDSNVHIFRKYLICSIVIVMDSIAHGVLPQYLSHFVAVPVESLFANLWVNV